MRFFSRGFAGVVLVGAVASSGVAGSGCGGAATSEPPRAAKRSPFITGLGVEAKNAPPPAPKAPPKADTSLLSRSALFANPDHALPLVSPDGKRIAFLAPEGGVLNVWVAPVSDVSKAKVVTQDKKRGIRSFRWSFTNEHILYVQDNEGDENFHLHAVDLKSGTDKDLTPLEGVQARIEGASHKVPGVVVVGLNDRDKRFHDLHRIDVVTGARTLLQKNDGYLSFDVDDDLKVRFAAKVEKDGSTDVSVADGKGGFTSYFRIPHEDALTTKLAGFDKTGKKAYLADSRGRDTAALVELDIATKATKVILDDGQADIRDIVQHPTDRRVQAATASYERLRWHVLDVSLRADLDAIAAVAPGDLQIVSRTLDDTKWTVASTISDGPVKFWLYDRAKKKTEYLFSNLKALESATLAPMHPVRIRARDGLELVTYLTLPTTSDPDKDARPDKPLPLVLFVHGGPWARDEYGLNRWHQWLAARGYAVMSVNYRGSTGFGKKFLNAADHEWAGKMHDDLLDAVSWAVTQKIAEKDKIAIMGGSYGGYATLVGLTFTPDVFACGVDIVGPSNLVTLLNSIPPYWEAEIEQFTKRIGDHRTEEGKKELIARSPLSHVGRIQKPLLIGQGANDPRVKQTESDQIVAAMRTKEIPVTYVLFPDEGHGFARPENRTSFNAVAEIFLAQCLGGPYEPIGNDFKGSSITVPVGGEKVHSVPDALKK